MNFLAYDRNSMARKSLIVCVLCAVLSLLAGCGDHHGHGLQSKLKVGDRAPASENLTVSNVDDWHTVSTMDTKVDLYQSQISDLVKENKPFLVVFGTPQHCTMCVDQIVRVAVMQEMFGESFAFIHVDGYKDNKVWVEWGVTGEPWTFFVDSNGQVVKIYPGQTELALLEMTVKQLLKES